jgi:hypothetical protein
MLPPHLRRRLFIALLASKVERVEFEAISNTVGVSPEGVRAFVRRVGHVNADAFTAILGEGAWMTVVEEAVREGVPLDVIADAIPWQRFEALTGAALIRHGFEIRRNVRFRAEGRRWEIDVLGLRERDLLCFDCKQWKKGGKGGAVRASAMLQRARTLEFSRLRSRPRWFGSAGRNLNAYAALITLLDTGRYIIDGCFIVPITKLNSFLDQFYELRGMVTPIGSES